MADPHCSDANLPCAINAVLDQHYSQQLSAQALLAEVDRLLPEPAAPEAFAAIDQLHLGGRKASIELLDGLNIHADQRVLDIGCGLGGSARLMAQRYGCRVVGIDLTADFCRLATALNQRLKQALPVQFLQADASRLPFAERSFDLLVSQHCIMNLPDPQLALVGFRRLLADGGKLVLHEILQGPGGQPYYPVPWASDADHSFLCAEAELKRWLQQAGLRLLDWSDHSQQALQWRRGHRRREQQSPSTPQQQPQQPPSVLTPQLIFGPRFSDMSNNLIRNLEQQRVRVVSVIVEAAT